MPCAAVPRTAADVDGPALTCNPIGVSTVSGPPADGAGAVREVGTVTLPAGTEVLDVRAVTLVVPLPAGADVLEVFTVAAEAAWPAPATSGSTLANTMNNVRRALMAKPYRSRSRGRRPPRRVRARGASCGS